MSVKWSVALLSSIVLVLLAILPVSAAVVGVPAVDGDGLMAVAPTNIAYGSSGTLVFTFTANNDFGAGSQVSLTIPAGWTPPTTGVGPGHISVSSGTCTLSGSPPYAVVGSDIRVDMQSCLTNQSFTINYSGTPTTGVTGSPYTFATMTDIGAGGQGLVPITAGSPTVTVDPKALSVSGGLTPTSKVYDGATSAGLTIGSPTLIGILNNDAVTLNTSLASAAFQDRNVGTAKPVDILGLALTGAQAGNYTITPPARTANITPQPITITAATDSKNYDGTTSSSGLPTITSGAIQTGDTAPVWTQTFNNRKAGTGKTLTPAGLVNDGNGGANYSYTYTSVSTGSISKYPITITAAGGSSKTYDRTTSSSGLPTITSGAIQTGDTAPVWTQTYDSAAAGVGKTLTPAGLVVDGNGGANYLYTYAVDTTGVILPKGLTVSSAGLTPNNKVYDGTTNGTGVTGSPALAGVISPDTVTLVTSGATYTFADKNAANGKLVHVTGLTLGGAQGANYSLTQPDRTANITKRAISVTGVTDSRVYDGTNHSSGLPTLTSGAIQTGDIEPAWTQTFDNKNVGTGKALTPAGVVVDGAGGSNYAYTFIANTTGVISPKAVTVTAISDTKIYDGTTHSIDIPNVSPALVGSDTSAFTQAFNTKDVGTGRTLTPSGVANDGNAGNNYSYTFVANTTGVITVRSVTVTAITDSKTYDGNTTSTAAPNISPQLYGTDTSGFTQSFASKDAGTNIVLTPAGVVNDGNGGADYSVTFATDNHGTILVKDITVTADPKSKAAGAADPPLTCTWSPALIAGDSFTGSLTRVAGTAYGTYAILQGTLTAGLNYNITYVGADLLIGPAISGAAGTANAVLSYTDGSPKSVTADGSGNYSIIVPSGWTGTVTPSKTGYVFLPPSTAYTIAVTSDVPNQNYTAHALVTTAFKSSATADGWILETGAKTGLGGVSNATSPTLMLGDDATGKQYRDILSFPTGRLGSTAVITNATLTLRKQGISGGGNPFTIFQGMYIEVRKGFYGTSAALEAADFQIKPARLTLGPFKPVPVGNVYTINLPPSVIPYINQAATSGGVTQVRLRFKLSTNGNSIANFVSFFSGNASNAAYRPTLTITYYMH